MNDNINEYMVLWESAITKCQEYLGKVILPYHQIQELYSTITPTREEYSLGSRYLPRGFYCPSPDITYIITNMKRGRIAKRITATSCPTNRFLFDSNNKLYLSDTFFPNGTQKTEYIFHEQGATYGVIWDKTFNKLDIRELNIEEHLDGKLSCYVWAEITPGSSGYDILRVYFETFIYHNNNHVETDFYIMQAPELRIKKHYNVFISHFKTGFALDSNNMILPQSFVELGYAKKHFLQKAGDGSPF